MNMGENFLNKIRAPRGEKNVKKQSKVEMVYPRNTRTSEHQEIYQYIFTT